MLDGSLLPRHPWMHDGQFEMGDTYARDIMNNGHLVLADDTWLEEYAS